ncbi:fluoride efflux transporter CrcB [Nonomuraea sp. SBT364]|uniref:fluoride efflux transporter CrcB n=1 Tax=Nonomuraea sp. SBT364 TaxID=1580530 RepID=UPI00066B15CF|nr:fluoride efflux transporter CrcB [Nonomuraea sp. SBT364]
MTVLLVVLGAAVGAPLRYLADRAVQRRHSGTFPWGTLTVNVAGSALLGFLAALPAGPGWTALAGTGFCGALTTYSTLGYETVRLAEEGAGRQAAANVLLSVAAGLLAAYGGAVLAHAVLAHAVP